VRIGHGWDRHRLATPDEGGRALVVGGVRLESPVGPIAHSDGDALYHAVTDALLGAIGADDIGVLFPNDDPRHDAEDSEVFLGEAVRRVREAGYGVVNLDATVRLERPRLSPAKGRIVENLRRVLGCEAVNVKGKTGEGVGPVGEGRAIEADAVVLVSRV